jgi:restriction-modification enzyme MmeI-like protein
VQRNISGGLARYCIWVNDADAEAAWRIPQLRERFEKVRDFRAASKTAETRPAARFPHRFRQIQAVATRHTLIMPQASSERREYLPVGLLPQRCIVSNLAFALYDAPLWNMAVIASRLHLVWIATICGKLETRYRYSSTLGWNTFPVPTLTDKNRADLTRCAEDILLTREAHFPATIANLYDPEKCPPICARRTSATTKCLSASISVAASATTQSSWKSCLSFTPKWWRRRGRRGKGKRRGAGVTDKKTIPSVSVSYARNGSSTKANALGMRPM